MERPQRGSSADQPPSSASAARGRATDTVLTFGFAVFALVFCFFYFTSPYRRAAREAIGSVGYFVVVETALVVLLGAAVSFLAVRSRRAGLRLLLGSSAAVVLALLAGLLVPGLRTRVLTLLLAVLVFTAATGFGRFLLSRVGATVGGGAEELVFSAALGLGGLALAFFLLGQAGLFRPWVLPLATVALGALGARRLPGIAERFWSEAARTVRGAGIPGCALLALAGYIYLFRLAYCFSPPNLGPLDYDALEYHLAAPLEWLQSGFVSFLPHNAYANMPASAGMLYAPGLALAPGRWSGLHFARLVNLGCSELATLAVFVGARRLANRRAALLAATIFFAGTWLADLTVNPYVEPLLLLATTAAVVAFLAAVSRGMFRWRRLVLAGLLAGVACATKYPALVLLVAPLCAATLLAGVVRYRGIVDPAIGACLVGIFALGVLAPWCLRNQRASRNPVYPLAGSKIPSPYWDARKERRWSRAHGPTMAATAAIRSNFWGRAGGFFTPYENLRTGPLLLVFLPLALWGLLRRRRRSAGWLALLLAAHVAGWALLTHQVPRFVFPIYGALALLAAVGIAELPGKLGRSLAGSLVLAVTLVALPGQQRYVEIARGLPPPTVLAGIEDTDEHLRSRDLSGPSWQAIEAINRLPAGSRVLLLGEVRRALFSVPCVYCTVWDTHPIESILEGASAREALDRLGRRGITHLALNSSEYRRLNRSYGYLSLTAGERRLLNLLLARHLERTGGWPGGWQLWKVPAPGAP